MGQKQIDEAAVLRELDAISRLFDRILAFFGPNVLQGPAGERLAQGMHERRQELVAMMSAVAKDVARANKSSFVYYPCVRRVPMLPCATRWVQIAPEAAEQLQRELKSDADGFVIHGRRIGQLFAGVADAPNTLACERTAGWCREQERDLRRRVEYARAAEHVPFNGNGIGLGTYDFQRGMVTIPDWTEFGSAQKSSLAQMQARRVAMAFGAPNTRSRQELAAVAAWLNANQKDEAALTEFWKHVGAQRAATLASVLNRQDRDAGMDPTKVFSDQSKQILTAFATSLATVTKSRSMYGQPGGGAETAYPLPNFHNEFVAAAKGDMWSASMLFKYGPKGDQWDTPFLSAMTKAVMEWRKTPQAQMPPNIIHNEPGKGVIEHKMPPGTWYARIGLTPGPKSGGPERGARESAIADHDPGVVLLGGLSENPVAARHALQDTSLVKDILSGNWTVPAFSFAGRSVDKSNIAGQVLATAAMAKRGTSEESRAATQIALNVMTATYEWSQTRDQKPPAGLQAGLVAIARSYIPDLANSLSVPPGSDPMSSSRHHITNAPVLGRDGEAWPWRIRTNHVVVQTFLKNAFSDEQDIADFRGRVQGYLYNTIYLNGGIKEDQPNIDEAVQLLRIADNLEGVRQIADAKAKDEKEAERKAFVETVMSIIGMAPTPQGKAAATVVEGAKKVTELSQPFMDSIFKPSDYAKKAKVDVRHEKFRRRQDLRVLLAQALIDRKELIPPRNAEWYKGNQVIPGPAFDDWYEANYAHKMASGMAMGDFGKMLTTAYDDPPPRP